MMVDYYGALNSLWFSPQSVPNEPPTGAILAEVLTPTLFGRWLAGHKPTAGVGSGRSIGKCPLARYLKETLPYKPITVSRYDMDQWVADIGGRSVILPVWAARFADQVDDRYHYVTGRGNWVPANVAIRFLYRACAA